MNTKLISIFAVAGIVSAGSTAFAINGQILPQKHAPSQISTENQSDLVTAQTETGVNTVAELTADNSAQDVQIDDVAISDINTVDTPSVPTVQNEQPTANQSDPDPSSTVTPTPTLPTVPPSFKPGQDDEDDEDDDSEYDDDESEDHGDDSDEGSQDDESHWEDDD